MVTSSYISAYVTLFYQCKSHSEPALYKGGILTENMGKTDVMKSYRTENGAYSPGFLLNNLTGGTLYSFSCKYTSSSSGAFCHFLTTCSFPRKSTDY